MYKGDADSGQCDELSVETGCISVIIPTKCQNTRAELLYRAIDSILKQTDVSVEIIVVVNGDHYDQSLVSHLENIPKLKIIFHKVANVSVARYIGLCHARGEYFCFIDDDDEFLEEAFKIRLALFAKHDVDFVITNGVLHKAGKDTLVVNSEFAKEILRNPAKSFLQRNWCGSLAPLFKRKSIDPELFNFSFKYFEVTYLFFLLLSQGKRLCFGEEATYRVYEDNPLSVSKTLEYSRAYPEFLLGLGSLPLEKNIKQIIHEKYLTALNMQSNLEMQRGELSMAWKSHVKCLSHGGWQYFAYTRHLLRSTLWLS